MYTLADLIRWSLIRGHHTANLAYISIDPNKVYHLYRALLDTCLEAVYKYVRTLPIYGMEAWRLGKVHTWLCHRLIEAIMYVR